MFGGIWRQQTLSFVTDGCVICTQLLRERSLLSQHDGCRWLDAIVWAHIMITYGCWYLFSLSQGAAKLWSLSPLIGTVSTTDLHENVLQCQCQGWLRVDIHGIPDPSSGSWWRKPSSSPPPQRKHQPMQHNISRHKQAQRQIQKKFRQEYWTYINQILSSPADMDTPQDKKTLWNYIKHCKKDFICVGTLRDNTSGELLT